MDPLYSKSYNNQTFHFNKSSKVVILELREKFHYAGKIFSWDDKFELEAFGINTNIIQFVLGTKAKLLINYHSSETKKEYWINYDIILKFIRSHNNIKHIPDSNVRLNNLPCSLFKEKPIFSGAS